MVIQTAEVEGTVEKPPVWDEHKSHRREMTLSNTNRNDDEEESEALQIISTVSNDTVISNSEGGQLKTIICPSCGHTIKLQGQGSLQNWPGLPAGVKFDPSDQEILQHLEAKVMSDNQKLHPLIDEFIPTIEGQNGICYTHPEKLPGVNKDGLVRHFFHRPSKAYTTGTRKRRKVHTDADGGETRWHKTGKTRPISGSGNLKGYKKILVLYTNYGRQRKPEKTNWVMHQYHLGNNEEEKDGELVVSKVFYQTQPRQCGSSSLKPNTSVELSPFAKNARNLVEYYNPHQFVSYDNVGGHNLMTGDGSPTLIPNLVVHGDGSSFIHLPSSASKGK